MSGGMTVVGGAVIKSWSNRQATVALSSGEAEFYSAGKAAAKLIGIKSMMRDMGWDADIKLHVDVTVAVEGGPHEHREGIQGAVGGIGRHHRGRGEAHGPQHRDPGRHLGLAPVAVDLEDGCPEGAVPAGGSGHDQPKRRRGERGLRQAEAEDRHVYFEQGGERRCADGHFGRVGWHDDHDHDHDDYEISAIGQHTQCYNCGGWGHMSRECPSEKKGKEKGKDFGKGGKDFGKGGKDYGKGGKDSGKGGKDSGKGYQGACFNCGKVGHKAWECRSRRQVGAVDEENYGNDEGEVQAGAVEIGTIWNIGGVEIHKVQKMEAENDPKTKAIEIKLDSGAGAGCWPAKLLKNISMKEKDKGVRFKAANGTELKYYGTMNIKFQSEGGSAT